MRKLRPQCLNNIYSCNLKGERLSDDFIITNNNAKPMLALYAINFPSSIQRECNENKKNQKRVVLLSELALLN